MMPVTEAPFDADVYREVQAAVRIVKEPRAELKARVKALKTLHNLTGWALSLPPQPALCYQAVAGRPAAASSCHCRRCAAVHAEACPGLTTN